MMKIWIDISNAPHVNFFKRFLEEWQGKYDVVVTARPLSNTIDLLEKHGVNYHCVGSHYGKKKISKLFGFFKRSNELYSFLKPKNISIAISQSSFYSPYVAKKLKIPCIYTNDNEFAKGNYVGFVFARHVLLPEALKQWTKKRFFEKRVTFYPGVKEGIYIKPVKKQNKEKFVIYFRPEPWHAQYHDFNANMFDDMLINLSGKYKIIILPRDHEQKAHFKKLPGKYDNIQVPEGVETVETISQNCDIFLGAGGSMTREFALMGIPTVSMYQGALLEVDKYLIHNGLLISETNPKKITINFIVELNKKKETLSKAHNSIYGKGKEARNLINRLIEEEINQGAQ